MSELSIPEFLDRKKRSIKPASLDERKEWLTGLPEPTEITHSIATKKSEADLRALQEIEEYEAAQKAAKAKARIAKMKAKHAEKMIPERFRIWNPNTSQFEDCREAPTGRSINSILEEKTEMTTQKKTAKPKAAKAAKKGTTAKKGKTARLIEMLSRKNGASLAEMLAENPLKGATPLATISAKVSILKREFSIERVGTGSGPDRRYRIVK